MSQKSHGHKATNIVINFVEWPRSLLRLSLPISSASINLSRWWVREDLTTFGGKLFCFLISPWLKNSTYIVIVHLHIIIKSHFDSFVKIKCTFQFEKSSLVKLSKFIEVLMKTHWFVVSQLCLNIKTGLWPCIVKCDGSFIT